MDAMQTVESFLDAWAACDSDRVVELFAEDGVFIASVGNEPGQTYRGRKEIRPAVEQMLQAAVGTRFHVREIIRHDTGFIVTWAVDGIAASGQAANVKGIDIFHIRDGAVTLKDAYRKVSA